MIFLSSLDPAKCHANVSESVQPVIVLLYWDISFLVSFPSVSPDLFDQLSTIAVNIHSRIAFDIDGEIFFHILDTLYDA
jgi:hypothetical protein